MTRNEIELREQRYGSYVFAKIEMKHHLSSLYPEYVSKESAIKYEEALTRKLAFRLNRFDLVLCLGGPGAPCIRQKRLTLEEPETKYALGFRGFP